MSIPTGTVVLVVCILVMPASAYETFLQNLFNILRCEERATTCDAVRNEPADSHVFQDGAMRQSYQIRELLRRNLSRNADVYRILLGFPESFIVV